MTGISMCQTSESKRKILNFTLSTKGNHVQVLSKGASRMIYIVSFCPKKFNLWGRRMKSRY